MDQPLPIGDLIGTLCLVLGLGEFIAATIISKKAAALEGSDRAAVLKKIAMTLSLGAGIITLAGLLFLFKVIVI